jgi:hypothetical protein
MQPESSTPSPSATEGFAAYRRERSVRLPAWLPALAALLALSADLCGQVVRGGALPGPLPLFPPGNWWNLDVSQAPVDPDSSSYVSFIGASRGLHPDFGGDWDPAPNIYGMVFVVVPGTQPLVPVAFDYAGESDAGAPGRPAGYPIPDEAKTQTKWIEGGYPGNAAVSGDKHMLIVDRDNRLLFETWNTRCLPAGSPTCSWRAGSGAVFPLDLSARRPDTWTSADAAGLAILPGLVRYDEVYGTDPIRHALRFTVQSTNGYVWPASHEAGTTTGALPMGARLRLKPGKDISGFAAPVQKIFQAMKTYGLIVADNGSNMYVQGTYDTRWDNGLLNPAFSSLVAGDFEVVELGWTGHGPGASRFVPVTPCRLLDTRNAAGADAAAPSLSANEERTISSAVLARCGIPAAARVLSVNVTAVHPAVPGDLAFYPGGTGWPGTSTISFSAGRVRANSALVALGSTAELTVRNGSAGAVDLVLDVCGYFR